MRAQGMLSIGAAMLGAAHVLGLDIDPDALEVRVCGGGGGLRKSCR